MKCPIKAIFKVSEEIRLLEYRHMLIYSVGFKTRGCEFETHAKNRLCIYCADTKCSWPVGTMYSSDEKSMTDQK